jgi:hypothetical protein
MAAVIESLKSEAAEWTVPFKHIVFSNGAVHLGGLEAGNGFPGTDTLSMSVHSKAVAFIESSPKIRLFLGEGDRLGGVKFFRALEELGISLHIFHLEISDEEQSARLKLRSTSPAPSWLRGRRTKVANVLTEFSATRLGDDFETNLKMIQDLVIFVS